MKTPHLVAYDYGQGAVWAIVIAESTAQIRGDFPELTVVNDRPAWMTDDELAKVEKVHTYDINDRTFGLLAEIIDARRKNDD
jgi:hypothetical protein